MEKRVERLRKSLAENNIDTLMVLVEENRRYLSGFTGEDTQFDETAGALFITD
ncbi:MAG: aminopeptidase P family N-terminal domain-containing protein, partial [Proteobacteria bacterium]|nr:aminopeptidase P family N-terminal domain-containing protein [Pseudomonadota bacterium]